MRIINLIFPNAVRPFARPLAIFLVLLLCLAPGLHAQMWHEVNPAGNGYTFLMSFYSPAKGMVYDGKWFLRTDDGTLNFTQLDTLPQNWNCTSLQMVDSLTAIALVQPESYQTGQRLWKTTDGGYHWADITGEDTAIIGSFYFLDRNTGYWGSKGKIFKSTDGGQNWTSFQFPNSMFCPYKMLFLDDQHGWAICLYAQGWGECMKTLDGGMTWTFAYSTPYNSDIDFFDYMSGGIVGSYALTGEGSISLTTDNFATVQYNYSYPGAWDFNPHVIRYKNASDIWVGGLWPAQILRSTDQGNSFHVFDTTIANYYDAIWDMNLFDTVAYVLADNNLIRMNKQMVVGLKDPQPSEARLELTPNPCLDQSTLTFASDKSCTALLQLLDVQGQVGQTLTLQAQPGNNQLPLDLTKLPPGLYLMRLALMEKVLTGKLLKGGR